MGVHTHAPCAPARLLFFWGHQVSEWRSPWHPLFQICCIHVFAAVPCWSGYKGWSMLCVVRPPPSLYHSPPHAVPWAGGIICGKRTTLSGPTKMSANLKCNGKMWRSLLAPNVAVPPGGVLCPLRPPSPPAPAVYNSSEPGKGTWAPSQRCSRTKTKRLVINAH